MQRENTPEYNVGMVVRTLLHLLHCTSANHWLSNDAMPAQIDGEEDRVLHQKLTHLSLCSVRFGKP